MVLQEPPRGLCGQHGRYPEGAAAAPQAQGPAAVPQEGEGPGLGGLLHLIAWCELPLELLVLRGPPGTCPGGGWSGLLVLQTLALSIPVCLSWVQALSNSRHPLGQLLRTLMLTFQATYSGIGANKHLQEMAQEEVKQHARELWAAYR